MRARWRIGHAAQHLDTGWHQAHTLRKMPLWRGGKKAPFNENPWPLWDKPHGGPPQDAVLGGRGMA